MDLSFDQGSRTFVYNGGSPAESVDIQGSCHRCRDLRLDKDKFIISETPKASDTATVSKFDPVGFGSLELGFLDDIYAKRMECSLCRLIYTATHSENGSGLGHDGLDSQGQRVSCSMEWHLDSRSSTSGASTRRLRIFNRKDQFRDFYIVPILTSDSDQKSNQARNRTNTAFDFGLAATWYNVCVGSHKTCGYGKDSSEPRFIPKRLVDVRSLRLCEFDQHETRQDLSYAALSYCWGRSQPLCTRKSNITELCLGITEDRLSKTPRDAIILAQKLGIDYIWIDALCIIQDDAHDWKAQAAQMDRIYTEASLTICAAVGDNCDCGIPGIHDTPMLQSKQIETYEGIPLTTLTPVSKIIGSTAWDSRAWTFQERLLARRCLISSPEGMIWQCKCTTWRDDVESCFDIDQWTLDLVGSPLTALQGNPLRSYTSCAEIYSGRRLSFLRDKVVAFEGISASLERRLGSSFKYSMPLRYLDWALLWVERDASVGNEFEQRYDKQKRTEFPSWSWCGWDLPVHWPRSSLEGTLFNLRDWFANRTWIVWYIGSSGQWNLAWDGGDHTSPEVHLNRWDGYISGQHDPYGRHPAAAGCRFRSQVTVDEVIEPTDNQSYPCLEGNLLFQTFTGHFSLSRKTMSGPVINTSQETRLRQFGIADSFGDWCGTITLDNSWFNQVGGIFEFAAISEAKDFSMEELDTWTYYVSEERQQAEWYCFYALMIRWEETKDGPVAERVGLAKIFQSAFFFRSLKPCTWKTIVLG